jgi:hypothetical protein
LSEYCFMIDPLAAVSLPPQRLSTQALVTVGVLHVAVLWAMLQSGAAVQATRQVVIQYFSPITQLREKSMLAPVQAATPVPKRVAVAVSPPARVETPALPVEPTPMPIIRKLEAQTAQRVTVKIQDIKQQTDMPPVAELPTTRIEPMLAPVPILPSPEPLPLPKPPPVQVQVPESAPPPLPMPPVPTPEPAVPPAAAPAPPSAPTPAAPFAAPARAAAITPMEIHSATANAAGGTGSVGRTALQPAVGAPPGGPGLNLNYNVKADNRGRQRTTAEMANEQLNGTERRDRLADGVSAAEKPDCINSGQALGLLAPIAIAYNVVKDKCK